MLFQINCGKEINCEINIKFSTTENLARVELYFVPKGIINCYSFDINEVKQKSVIEIESPKEGMIEDKIGGVSLNGKYNLVAIGYNNSCISEWISCIEVELPQICKDEEIVLEMNANNQPQGCNSNENCLEGKCISIIDAGQDIINDTSVFDSINDIYDISSEDNNKVDNCENDNCNINEKNWIFSMGGINDDIGYSIKELSDGNLIMVGSSRSYTVGGNDVWIIKIDRNGNIIWQKNIGGNLHDIAYSVSTLNNGNILIIGKTASFGSGVSDLWILIIDNDGNIISQNTFGGDKDDWGKFSISTNQDYLVIGSTASFGAGSSDIWIIKFDNDGNILWQKTFGGTGSDEANFGIATTDGNYLIIGRTDSYGASNFNFIAIKFDLNGNILWQKIIGGNYLDEANSLIEVNDGYIIAGRTNSYGAGDSDIWLTKLDLNGNNLWQKAIGGTGNDWASSIMVNDYGEILVTGITDSYEAGNSDQILIKINSDGSINEQKLIGSTDDEIINYSYNNKRLFFIGSTASFGNGGTDLYLITLNEDGIFNGDCNLMKTINLSIQDTYSNVNDTTVVSSDTTIAAISSNAVPHFSTTHVLFICQE